MPRQVTHGTPSLSPRYMRPRRMTLARWSAVAIAGIFAVIAIAYAGGLKTVASPGAVAVSHSRIDNRCAQCHAPASAANNDLRCERCHDPIDTRRFENGGHAIVNGRSTWHAMKQTPMACGSCHEEHRGNSRSLAVVNERRCATCHDFASFGRHPEFGAVRSRHAQDEGMEFSHFTHLNQVTKAGLERCASCHSPTNDLVGFEAVNFDKHCARCHIKDGALTLDGVNPLVSGNVFADLLLKGGGATPAPQLSAPDGRGRVTFTGVGHKDPWVLANLDRLSQALTTASRATERARLQNQQARLNAIINSAALSLQAERDLTSWRDDLQREMRTKRTGNVNPASSTDDLDPAVESLAAQIAAVRQSLTGTAAAPVDARSVADRRQEIQALLDAIAARTTGPLAERAAALKKQLGSIRPQRATAKTVDAAALDEMLNDVDSALIVLQSNMKTGDAAAVAAARDLARRQLDGSLDQPTYDGLKQQLVAKVDAIAAGADSGKRARIAELRAAVAALPDRAFGPTAMDRQQDRARLLERLETEIALRTDRSQAQTPGDKVSAERDAAARDLRIVSQRLQAIDADTLAVPASDLGRAKAALRGLVGICVSCHRLNTDETALLPTALNGPVMPRASYSHKPHRGQEGCETCHNSVQSSKSATDTNVPGIATCQSCHKPSQAKSTCNECHLYHPRSSAELAMAMR